MSNSFDKDEVGSYPLKHNKRELKLIETVYANLASRKSAEFAAAAADYAILDADGYEVILVNDQITITLPAASTNAGRRILFVQKAAAVLTVAQNADGANIAGADSDYTSLDAAGDRAELVCTGAEWLVVSSTIA